MKSVFALLFISCLLVSAYGGASRNLSLITPKADDEIDAIRAHYATINKGVARYRKVKKDLSGYSTEGGTLEAYFDGASVKKIVATFYGEGGKAVEEYYYWDDQLIFVYRKESRYSAPSSGKVVSATEDRFYFNGGRLIRWVEGKGKQVAPDKSEYGEKQKEYLENSGKFVELVRSKG
ncbi:MAG TPA: hypothetical protein VF507_00425 [Pyrinomonadaceae bacterium]|jgi:hypothetical protein